MKDTYNVTRLSCDSQQEFKALLQKVEWVRRTSSDFDRFRATNVGEEMPYPYFEQNVNSTALDTEVYDTVKHCTVKINRGCSARVRYCDTM